MGQYCECDDDGDTYTEVRLLEHTPNSKRLTLSLGGTMLGLKFKLAGSYFCLLQ